VADQKPVSGRGQEDNKWPNKKPGKGTNLKKKRITIKSVAGKEGNPRPTDVGEGLNVCPKTGKLFPQRTPLESELVRQRILKSGNEEGKP